MHAIQCIYACRHGQEDPLEIKPSIIKVRRVVLSSSFLVLIGNRWKNRKYLVSSTFLRAGDAKGQKKMANCFELIRSQEQLK